MTRSRRRLAILAATALALTGVAVLAGPSPATGQGEPTTTVQVGDLDQPVVPSPGFPARDPIAGPEAAPPPSTNDGVEGQPLGTESVIGPDGRSRVLTTTGKIARRIGQIEISQAGVGNFICTGWLIDLNSILTSGHCAFDHQNGGLIEAATWYPGRNGATDPFGGCAVQVVFFPQNDWQLRGKPNGDYAVMNFVDGGPCENIGNTLGTFGLMAVPNLNGLNRARATVQGYPGDKPDGTMWKMNGRIKKGGKRMLYYPMDTFGGQSGSPIWWNRAGGACTGACGYGVHSYGVGLPGPGQKNNSGPRLTAFRIGQIQSWAAANG